MLGLVLGPGEVLGVGLVVLGVSVPMPPADEPEDDPPCMSVDSPEEVPDEVSDEELPPDVPFGESEGMPDELSSDDVPPVDAPPELVVLLSDEVPDVPSVGVEGLPVELVPELLVSELSPMPEPPPVMPVHAPSSTAQAIGNIHFVIDHSRKFQMTVRTVARTERTALLMQRVEAGGE